MASIADILRGYGETALTLGSGAAAVPVGGVYGILKSVTSPEYGTQKGVKIANEEAKKIMRAMTYEPKSKEAKKNLEDLNKLFEASKLPPIMPELMPLAGMKQYKTKGNASESGTGFFDTGDIRRVGKYQPNLDPTRLTPNDLRAIQGNLEAPEKRRNNAAALAQIIRNPELNPAIRVATQINPEFNLDAVRNMPPSSLQKQFPIGKVYEQMAKGIDPELEKAIFNNLLKENPEIIRKSGATNYRELVPASYEQLAKENAIQMDRMLNDGMKMSYHKGDLNYANSREMLEDALINKHLYTFGGGDRHELLNKVDPYTGLNENQTFRAVHDFLGHGTTGSTFGPLGEELAYGAHSQLYSPLAKLAAATETRGQNSFVNYSGKNANLQLQIDNLRQARDGIKRQGGDTTEYDKKIKELSDQTQYAEQKAFILPPEMIGLDYKGGIPEYVRPFINPNNPKDVQGLHWSNKPDLIMTDPSKYGTGIKGSEAYRLNLSNALRDRTYFYTDPNKREPGLGANQYEANLRNMYDTDLDPDSLKALAQLYTRYQGIPDKDAELNALERIAREAGYEGIVNELGAISFVPQSVKRRN